MQVDRARDYTKAYWRSEEYWCDKWTMDTPGQDICERLIGHAAGWEAGVRWARRQMKKKTKASGKRQ
jgi:hypothetical protein